MLNLSRAWSGVLTKATPLPDVWDGLKAEGIKFRRGQVCMVAAAPNAGKSMFALIYAIKAKVPTLFFSADTDTTTVMMRSVSHLSGHSQVTVEANLSDNSQYYNAHLDKLSHIKWVFDSSPNIDDLELEIRAYVEINLGYKSTIGRSFDTDQEAKDWIQKLKEMSGKTFEVYEY